MSEYVSDCGSLDDLFDEASLALVEVEVHSPEPRVSKPDAVRTSTATHNAAVLATASAERLTYCSVPAGTCEYEE